MKIKDINKDRKDNEIQVIEIRTYETKKGEETIKMFALIDDTGMVECIIKNISNMTFNTVADFEKRVLLTPTEVEKI